MSGLKKPCAISVRFSQADMQRLRDEAALRGMSVTKLAEQVVVFGLSRLAPPVDIFGEPLHQNGAAR